MCGIVGFVDARARGVGESETLVRNMARAIAHRGPDGDGAFVDPECGVALGHRRLSIIDLSDAGSQPMTSADGRWVVSYNGEIYNFEEMRKSLEQSRGPRSWRGHSDTEVLLETIAAFGVEEALKRTNGMFAIAIWDRSERVLYLARDRMGEKPVYYGWAGSAFLFGSEIKALAVHPQFSRRINPAAVSEFLSFGYVPNPLAIFESLAQLPPAHYLKLPASAAVGTMPRSVPYWTLPVPAPRAMDERSATDTLDELLRDAIRLRMRADVPMGAFLSGGIDSSTIVALMQAQSTDRIRSYSIGFHERDYNEAEHAQHVARHIGTAHTEMYVTPDDARELIPTLPQLYDEPFADSSQLPTYLLCKLTRQHVTVSLSGDGGDEIFGGYGRYFDFEKRWALRTKTLNAMRPLAAAAIEAVPACVWPSLARVAPHSIRNKLKAYKAKRVAAAIGSRTEHQFYKYLMEHWSPKMLRRPAPLPGGVFFDQVDIGAFPDPFLGMMYTDMGSYLPDDILVKVDRAAMAVSLESRVPLLDHRIVEFAAGLPIELKRRNATGKWILRQVLDRYVPSQLIDRPKQGFGVPIAAWLRGPLKEWGDELVNDRQTVIGELVDLRAVNEVWKEHQQGDVDHSYRLWVVLMLVAWGRAWRPV